MNICLIPARIGSQRLKKKNIKKFFGKPLISYAILNAKKTNLFQKIIVSTDSKIITKIAIKNGAEVPFIRPKNLSNDKATDAQVRNHFLKYCKRKRINIEYLCYLYPATPLLKISTLKRSLKIFKKTKFSELMTVSKNGSLFSKSFTLGKYGEVKKFNKTKNSIKSIFYDAGQFYWYNLNSKIKKKYGYKLNKTEGVDVNTIKDFNLIKKLYLLKKRK